MKKLGFFVVVLALLAFALPAFGGPSPLGLAKKALKTAKKADKRGRSASAKAGRALASASAGVKVITISSGDVSAAPNDFARFDVRCPVGYAGTGSGHGLGALELVADLPTPYGYIASYYNPSSSSFYSGTLHVVCAKGAWSSSASTTSIARRDLIRAERRFLAAH